MFRTWTGSEAMGPVASPNSPGPGGVSGVGGWHPTVLYLVVLLAFEIFLAGLLSRTLLR
jgi:hypothetical protein